MLAPGDLIGSKLRVIRRIGAGGMGVVYEAMQLHLGRRVAVKVIPPGDAESRARFMREARAQAQLPSEHIVQVLDVDTLPDGTLYTIMEYLEGRDLQRELKRRGKLPVAEAAAYLVQACAGASAAHAAGIVHRDLKPQNLFVTNLDGKRRVKLLDFGIAKLIDGNQDLTESSVIVGTPSHLAPEQISGGTVDGRTDIWGLGTVLFELLAGTTPFRREGSFATFSAISHEAPPSLCELRPDVPAELGAIVARCLEKRPADRFATVVDLTRAVEPYATFDGIVTPSHRAPRGSSAPPRPLVPEGGLKHQPLAEPPWSLKTFGQTETREGRALLKPSASGVPTERLGVEASAEQPPKSALRPLTPLWLFLAAASAAIGLSWALTRQAPAIPTSLTIDSTSAVPNAVARGDVPVVPSRSAKPAALPVMSATPSAVVESAPVGSAVAHRQSTGAHARSSAQAGPTKAPVALPATAETAHPPRSLAADAVPMHL